MIKNYVQFEIRSQKIIYFQIELEIALFSKLGTSDVL